MENRAQVPESRNMFPGTRVFCRSVNDGNGARVLLIEAQKGRADGRYCYACPAGTACAELNAEMNRQS